MAHGLLTFALLALFVGALVGAGVAWVVIVFWQVRMIRSRRPGVSV
jgi:acyl dehydratase